MDFATVLDHLSNGNTSTYKYIDYHDFSGATDSVSIYESIKIPDAFVNKYLEAETVDIEVEVEVDEIKSNDFTIVLEFYHNSKEKCYQRLADVTVLVINFDGTVKIDQLKNSNLVALLYRSEYGIYNIITYKQQTLIDANQPFIQKILSDLTKGIGVPTVINVQSLMKMKLVELQQLAKSKGIKYSKIRKHELAEIIANNS